MKRGSGAIQPNAKPISSTKRTPPTDRRYLGRSARGTGALKRKEAQPETSSLIHFRA